jgi:DNA-binding NtrC family response regulator
MRILVVDDESIIRKSFCRVLADEGFEAEPAADGEEAMARLAAEHYDLVFSDLRMPRVNGIELLRYVRAHHPDTIFVILTGYGSISSAVAAMKEGAHNYITKPLNRHELLRVAHEVREKTELQGRVEQLQSQLEERYSLHSLVGRSPAMQRVYDLIEKLKGSDCNVLIVGESGTGKELVARALHYTGPRAETPFVAVNCGALPESIAERELFGHERGAFTGADRTQPGYFEGANTGTLFLDEFTELPLSIQVKLLRVLEQREIIRVGSTAPIPVDVRILAATNRDPKQCVADGMLREDLYYRLNVVTIPVPALRERGEDTPLLVQHFLARDAERSGGEQRSIDPAALKALMENPWPGNVRELENVIERTLALCTGPIITLSDLPPLGVRSRMAAPLTKGLPFGEARKQLTEQFEQEAIVIALSESEGNVTHAAEALGLSRSVLQRLMKRHDIDPAAYR